MRRSIAALALVLGFFSAAAAHASSFTYNIGFSSALSQLGLAPSGSFTLVLDPLKSVTADSTAGLTVNNLSFNGGTSAYLYNSTTDTLTLGGTANGVGNVVGLTNDYLMVINNLTSSPTLGRLSVSQAGLLSTLLFTATTQLDVTSTAVLPPVAVTPEPSSLVLLATGLFGVGTLMRRRMVA